MKEKKKKKVALPIIMDATSGELRKLNAVSYLIFKHKDDRCVRLAKTEADTYALFLDRKTADGEDVHQELYMSRDGFADLCCTLLAFLDGEGVEDFRELFTDFTEDDFAWNYVKEGDEIEEGEE